MQTTREVASLLVAGSRSLDVIMQERFLRFLTRLAALPDPAVSFLTTPLPEYSPPSKTTKATRFNQACRRLLPGGAQHLSPRGSLWSRNSGAFLPVTKNGNYSISAPRISLL